MHQMSMGSRIEYLIQIKRRYLKAKTKTEKFFLLNEIVETTGMNRRYLIGLLQAKFDLAYKKIRQRKRRKPTYDGQVLHYLKKVWDILDCPCGQRLAPVLSEMIKVLERCKEILFPNEVKEKLQTISSSTIDRLLREFKAGKRRRLHGTTKPGSLLKKQIPIVLSRYNVSELGHSEIDLAAHNGGNPEGEFANTLTDTDLSSGWTEEEAFLGKAQTRVQQALENIDHRRPFKRKSIDSDTGAEFINWHLYDWCVEEKIIFTRGRPGKKNDNPHVEQKNWTHVRKLVGYHRYDTEQHVGLLNDLYRNEWRLYENFFQPTIKLVEKKRIGGHVKKTYEIAKTPYQRIMESKEVNEQTKAELKNVYESLNPAELKRQIERKLDALFKTLTHYQGQQEKKP